MLSKRAFLVGASAAAVMTASGVRAQTPKVKIGVITDITGPLSAVLGLGSVDGARMAIEDFGGKVGDMEIELVSADHQGKADIAAATARKWIDVDGVDLILDLGQSAAALAVQNIVKERNKIIIVTGAASSEITGKNCNQNSFHWGYDTYMQSAALADELTRQGNDTWFFLTIDYAYGHTLQADATRKIEARGGRVVGSVRHPSNTQDFSSFLLQAQASKAKMIGIASAGDDLERTVRQGAEFGIWGKQKACAFGLQLYNVPSIGIPAMQGILHNSIFYWDRNEGTRELSKRFWKRNGKPPAETHAVNYSAITHYLKAIKAAGTKDPQAVLKAMRELPVEDVVTEKGQLRNDGRLIRPTFLVAVKKPEDVKEQWDLFNVVNEIPGDVAFKPLSESTCPLVKA